MMTRVLGCLLVLFPALWLAVGSDAQASESRARLEPRDCWFDTSRIPEVECAALFVPTRWESTASVPRHQMLRLRVVRYRAGAGDRDEPPVFYLAGGPGYSAVPEGVGRARAWRQFADRQKTARDVVLFDQRGTGKAYPRLDCPDALAPRVWGGLSEDAGRAGGGAAGRDAALRACLDRYRELGRDLGAFTSRQSAADVDALRHALGYERIVLYGQAYGSSLALTVMADFPESVAAALLDSVQPPETASGWLDPAGFRAALDRLLDACEAHGNCGQVYPDLRRQLGRTLARLYVEPVLLEIQNLKGTAPLYARIDDVAFLDILFWEMLERPGLQTLPMMIAGFARGEHWRLRSHAENYFYSSARASLAIGMTHSVACHEQFPLTSVRDVRRATAEMPFLTNWAVTNWRESPCHFWPVEPSAPPRRGDVVSDAPTLLVSGALDPLTPIELAELAARSLPNSHHVVIPNGGHTVTSDRGCAGELVIDFLADPTRRPDSDCLKDLPPPAFTVLGGN